MNGEPSARDKLALGAVAAYLAVMTLSPRWVAVCVTVLLAVAAAASFRWRRRR